MALLLLAGLGGTMPAAHNQPLATPPDVTAYVLVVLAAMPLLVWRAAPVAVFAANQAVTLVYLAQLVVSAIESRLSARR